MGWLSDNLDFELFNLGDMWDKLKDNPEQLILGVDPFSTKLWNELGVTDNEPIVNQLGGPMGGGGLGIGSGGVYDRAQEAGIDIGPATQMHDIAEVVASYYGARGLGGIGGGEAALIPAAEGGGALGAGGGAAGGGLGGGTAVGSAAGGGAAAPAGGGAGLGGGGAGGAGGSGGGGMFDFANMDWMDYMNMMPQGGGQEQQQQAGPRPMPAIGNSPGVQMAPPQPLAYTPPRSLPFGLLDEDEEEKRRKELALLGGLL
jgi:hypothetical protein